MIRPGKQTGYILLPVIVVITLVAAIALLMNTESALESNTAASELNAQQAQYVAEAGMNHALWLARQQGCGPYGNLTNEPLANDNYSSTLTTDLGSTNAVTINVDQDSWISSDSPADNKGNDQNLHIRFEGGVIERPMFRYDLSPIPAKAVILSATAWFYVDQEHPEGQVDIHRITADWSEADATWDSMGANLDFPVLAVIPAQPDMGVWVSVNLTSQVQAWVNGQSNFGITLNSTSEGTNGDYNSRESANPPYLEVIVGTPPSSPAVLKAVGTLANGVTRSLVRDEIGLIQSPSQLLQLQPDGAEVMDTYLDQSNPGYNNGISDSLWLEQASGNDDDHVLLKFPLGRIPIDARIQQASLQLYQSLGTTSGGEVSIHRVRREWEEGNDSFTNGPGVTWNNATTTEVWAVAGGEFDAAAIATTTINPSTTGYYDWDITPLVQGWMANQIGNHGMMIVADTTGTLLRFRSSDHGTVVERPKLTVTYSCTCGEVCVPPQGNGKVLLLRNRNDPDPTDTQKQALFESWGYTVNLLDDWDDQATYNAAMASNDVMFISGASPFAVGNKLNNAPIGVVNERGELNDELGIATGRASPVGDSIDVIDTDHYITSIFTNAPLQVMTAGVELTTVGGTTAPSAQVLAEIGGTGALVTLDKGGLNSNGDTAPARRVLLPAGESEVDWLMTNNGALIVQRAIEWGIGDKKTLDDENIILSTAGGATLGGLTFTDKDLAEYDPVTDNGSLYLDGVALSLAQDIDAVHVLANGHIVLSAINTITLGSITSENEDLIDYDPVADSATLMFDGSALFTSGSTDISAVHVLDNGHLLLTNEYTATLGGLSFGPNDIVDYDPVANSATLFFDGDAVGFSGWINALHLLSNGNIVLSANTTNTLGTLSFHSGDLIEYDPVADLATLYLDGDLFSAEENIRSAHVGPGTGGDAPIGPYNVLFVVGNVGGPGMTAEEIDHRTLIESWGHTVEIIDDGASQTDFDTAVANNDVVFTTNDITASTLGTKLVNAPIGVVTSEDNLSDEFGLASAIGWESGSLVEINDNSHYITSPFATGLLTILTASESLAYVTGTLSPDLGQLASSTSGYGIVTLEAGETMFGGGSTAGRRAQLPWGGSGFDPNHFNDDGRTILKRALEWGAGEGADTGPIAHWKLDDGSGITAIDSEGGHDGTLINPPAWVAGTLGDALDFDGSNDYVDLTSDAELDDVFVGGATVMAWIKPAGWGENGYGRVFDKSSSPSATGDGWVIRMNVDNGGIINFGQGFTGGRGWWKIPNASISLDSWQHIAIAYDASSTANDPIIYLDGSPLVVTEVDTPSGTLRSDAAINLRLGNYAGGTTHTFDGIIDDARIYDRMLSAAEIADIAAEFGGSGGASYIEMYQPWSAPNNDTWEAVNLGAFGVPANAVVEVAVVNARVDRQFWGGVREVGSTLDRRLQLHEAEAGGLDVMVMTVQTDALAQIEHYSDTPADVTFILLGYWTVGSFVEAWDFFDAGASNTWRDHSLSTYGVPPSSVAEILVLNDSTGNNYIGGVRSNGSGYQRRFGVHEPEGGGKDTVTLMVNVDSDAGATIEVFAQSDSGIDFYLMGHWSTPPGTYTETGGAHGSVTAPRTWETIDLTSYGVPANSVAQFVLTNERDGQENQMGVRETGSTINNRRLDLQEAEAGGSDLGSMHVNVDASSQVQWAAEYGATEGYFYPVGWWVLSP